MMNYRDVRNVFALQYFFVSSRLSRIYVYNMYMGKHTPSHASISAATHTVQAEMTNDSEYI